MTRDEVMKKWKKREGENSSLSSSNYQKGDGYKRYAERQVAGTIGEAYNKGVEALNNIYNGWNSAEDLARNKQIALDSAKVLNAAKNQYNLDTYDNLLDSYNKGLSGIDSAAEEYSHYLTGEAYNKAQKKFDFSNKYRGASYDDIQSALKSATDQDEISYLKGYTDFNSLEDFDKAIATEQSKINELSKGGRKVKSVYQDKLKTARTDYERTHRYDKYADITNNDDFEEKASENMSRLKAYEQGTALDPMRLMIRGNIAFSDSLDEEQQKVAAYLYGQGEKDYLDYMKDMTYIARKNEANEIQDELSAQTEEHPVLSAIEYPLFNAFYGGAAGAESIASVVRDKVKSLITGEQADYNPTTLGLLTSATRQQTSQISQNIRDNTKTPIPQFAYDVFATEVPNRVGQMMYGSAYNVVMGMDVFATSYSDAVMNGMSPEKALWNAFVEGGLEFLTEWKGMEWAFGEGKNAATKILKQAFAEGSEEVVSSLGYLIYDKYKNGGEAEFRQNVQKYIEMGYSPSEAEKKASSDYIKDLAYQFAVAAFSTVPTTGFAEATKAAGESYSGQFVNREKIGEINAENLQKKYGDEWTKKASNREVYRAYSDYVENLQEESTKAEKEATKNAIAQEYKISEEEAEKWTEALYNGDKKALKTHFGEVLRSDLEKGEGWTTKADTTEVDKISSKIRDAFKMVKSENQMAAEKASKTLKTGEKNTVNGKEAEIISMKENKDGSFTVKTSEGNVDAKDVTVTDKKATALTYSANIENEALKEAYVRYYDGEDISDYDTYARYLYNAGKQGVDFTENTQILDTLGTAKAQALYNVGVLEAMQEEIEDNKALENVTKQYAEKFRPGTFKAGDYSNGKFKENKDFFRNLNRTQKRLYRIIEVFSKLSGINVRVYIDRDAASENGQFIAGKNGGTIYINLAARPFGDSAYGINQYVISTLSHELTHWLKANNREVYDILEEAVKKDLQKNNTYEKRLSTERETLLKTHENELKESDKSEEEIKTEMEKYSKKKDLDEIAMEEVVARACEDMLNDSDTMQEVLSFADQDGLTKLQTALNKWFDHIRGFFRDLMGGFHAPNEVVADLQDSYDHLKELWVKGVKEAIAENRREQKSTQSKKVASVKNSVKTIIGYDGTNYGRGVYLDSTLLTNISDSERREMVRERVKELGGQTFTAFDTNGNPVNVKIAEYNRKFKNAKGKKVSVNKDLVEKYDTKTKQESVVLADELIETSHSPQYKTSTHSHDWLDDNGNNMWEYWITYIEDRDGNIWEATLNIANANTGEKILYDIAPIKKKGQAVKSATSLSSNTISQPNKQSNNKKSVKMDSEGRTLTTGQQTYFEKSQVRDDQGRLLVMYHGSKDFGFTVFDPEKSDDKRSLFFTDSKDMADTYVGNKDKIYEVYLDLQNPFVLDAHFAQWNGIVVDEDLKMLDEAAANVYNYVRLVKRLVDYNVDLVDVLPSLGEFSDSTEFFLKEAEENDSEYTEEEKAEFRAAAKKADESFRNWNDDEHLDEDGEPQSLEDYIQNHWISILNTRQLAKRAKERGYDGVIIKNVYDNGKYAKDTWYAATVVIAFNSEQVKSVTNENPTKDKDIRKSTKISRTELNKVEKIAKEHFGVTDDFRETGYILLDGSKLDFSGAHWLDKETYSPEYIANWKKRNDLRQVDHEDIAEAYEKAGLNFSGDNRLKFINQGNIRVMPEYGAIELSGKTEPTDAQYKAIRDYVYDFIDKYTSGLVVEIDGIPQTIQYADKTSATRIIDDLKAYYREDIVPTGTYQREYRFSQKVSDKATLKFLNDQLKNGDYITTYKSMRLDDGKLHSPMAALINGKYENEYELGEWYEAVEHPELMTADGSFKLDKGKSVIDNTKLGNVNAKYNPYEHSTNYVLNDQFSSAYKRPELVTVEMRVPKSEVTSGYKAQFAKDSVGWTEWKSGDVSNKLRKKGITRKVFLSRWAMPVRILPDSEVAQKYKDLIEGTDIEVPDNTVTPSLLNELEKLNVPIKRNVTEARKSVRLDSVERIGAAEVDKKTGTAVYSVRYTLAERYKELGYNSYAEAVGKTAEKIAKQMGVSKLKAEDWIKAEESLSSIILKDAENQRYLDYAADDRYSAIKTDTDYPQGTIDLSNLCRKREIFTKMFDNLQRENPDVLFTAEDIAKIRQILTEANYEVACALCYVEDRRQHIGEIAKSFTESYQKALKSKDKVIYRTNSSGELKPLKVTEEQASKYGLKKGDTFKATDKYVPNQYDLTTYQGYKDLVENHPTIAVAFENFNNSRGQSAARLIEGHAEYKREILDWNKSKVDKANSLGGLRVFSFSDFEAIHLIDIVQVVMDCATKGVMIQAYTKVPSFANLVKDTGIKLNRSLIPANKGSKNAYAYVNGKAVKIDSDMWVEDGIAKVNGQDVLAFDTVEGIDITDENFLDMSDNKNVGNILVGISKRQIEIAMEDDFIDYIIPFHTNQAKEILEAKNIHKWNNYKVSQLDKKINGKGKDHGINIYTDVINKYNIRNKKEFVRAFLNECKNQKYKPRFEEFLKKNSKGDYIYTEGYHKFLVDYKLFDKNGNILKQEAVRPDFDKELMNKILMADKARSMNMKFSDEIMEKVKTELSNENRTVKSVKLDSEGNKLTEGQQKYFAESKVRDDQGRLLVVYHGTFKNFDTFDIEKANEDSYRGSGFYFTSNSKEAKETYATLKGGDSIDKLNQRASEFLEEWGYGWEGDIEYPDEYTYNKIYDSNWNRLSRTEAKKVYDKAVNEAKKEFNNGRVMECYLNVVNPYIISADDSRNPYQIQTDFAKGSYDGIIDYRVAKQFNLPKGTVHITVFESNQIKSVDNENPTENPSTLKSTKLPAEAQKLINELTRENKRLTKENTALKAEKGIEQEKAEKKAIIDKITEQSQVLSRWLLTNDKTNPVPQVIKEPLGKLLTSISFTKDDYEWRKQRGSLTKSEETLGERMAKISQLLNEIEQDKVNDADAYDLSQLDWIPEFSNEFAKIKDAVASVEARQGEYFNLGKMTTEDLQSLLNMITALKSAITNMNKCLSAHNKMSVDGVGKEIIRWLDEVGQKKIDNRALQFLEIDNTVPFYFFKRLGPGGQQAFKLLMDGMNQYAFEAKQIEDYAKQTFSGKDVLSWRDEVKPFQVDEVEYNAEQGKDLVEIEKRTIQMTVPQIMSLYCLSKRDQAVRHLNTGGIKIGDFKVKGEKNPVRQIGNVTLTKKDIEKITSSLTKEQIEVADKLQEFMNTVCQKWGNEITMKRFGFKGMTEKNYFPINVDRNQLSSEARQRGSSLYQLLNMGFTKPINPKAKNPIEIFDIFEVFAIHSTEMAQYNSLALPVLDVIRIWNYKDLVMLDENEDKAHWNSVKASIENTIGAKGNQYIGLLLADLNGDVSGGRADDFAAKLMKNYKTAAVAANLQVAALQPLSYVRAGYMIDSKYLTKGMAMKSTDDALKYCGIAVWKDMGFYNTSIHRGLEHKIMQDDSKKDQIIEKTLYLAGKADEWTWSKLWNACLLETKDKYPNLKDQELYEKTAERLTEIIYGTQVVDSILTRSQIMRDKTMYSKMVTAFQSEPTLALNVLMDASESFSMEARAHGKQAAIQKYGETMKRAALVYLISSAVESAFRTVFGRIRGYDGDDDEENIAIDFLKRLIEELNPLRKIPIIKDIWSILFDSLKVVVGWQYKLYTDTRMDEAIFENIGKAVIRIGKLIQGKEINFKVLYEIAKGIDATGLPVSSTFRTFKTAWNNTIGRIWTSLALK